MNEKAAAINDDADGTFEAQAQDGGQAACPLRRSTSSNHGLTWPVREVDGTWLSTAVALLRRPAGRRLRPGGRGASMATTDLRHGVSFYKIARKPSPRWCSAPTSRRRKTPDERVPVLASHRPPARALAHRHHDAAACPSLHRALPEALLNMNPDDCAALGVADGDMVHVTSRFGRVRH